MGTADNSDELGADHFGLGEIGLTYADAESRHILAVAGIAPGSCIHFGRVIETRTCEGCGGKRIAVHACVIHGECTLQANRDGVKLCPCPGFMAKPSA